jgi:caffeoyl-CoA O-methyltransferase
MVVSVIEKRNWSLAKLSLIIFLFCMLMPAQSQNLGQNPALDSRVKKFLDSHAGTWHDLNVPASDGKLLYDLVLKNKYTKALEIGTSTGHSGIWIAWALSKTGGKLITIEIDEERHKQAVANFKECGLSNYIDARLADAHDLVKELPGPFDFIFSDADKEWYKQYFIDLAPKLKAGGCFAAHNVPGRRGGFAGIQSFTDYVLSQKNFETTFNNDGAGVSISYRRSEK